MDGPVEITQPPILPGENYTYELTATQHGTYFYHRTPSRIAGRRSASMAR
jgi:FtsP/CotA-like multicopper oxidase with cupredoxin domain